MVNKYGTNTISKQGIMIVIFLYYNLCMYIYILYIIPVQAWQPAIHTCKAECINNEIYTLNTPMFTLHILQSE